MESFEWSTLQWAGLGVNKLGVYAAYCASSSSLGEVVVVFQHFHPILNEIPGVHFIHRKLLRRRLALLLISFNFPTFGRWRHMMRRGQTTRGNSAHLRMRESAHLRRSSTRVAPVIRKFGYFFRFAGDGFVRVGRNAGYKMAESGIHVIILRQFWHVSISNVTSVNKNSMNIHAEKLIIVNRPIHLRKLWICMDNKLCMENNCEFSYKKIMNNIHICIYVHMIYQNKWWSMDAV